MIHNYKIPRELQDLVNKELQSDERMEWIDMPVPRYFTTKSKAMFLFAIPWTAFSIFWIAGASGFKMPDFSSGPGLFPLFGVPFLLLGIYMLLSPVRAFKKAFKTVYVVTNQRALTVDGGRSLTIRSYPPKKLQDVYRKEKRDGTGDVIIAVRAWKDSDGDEKSEELGFLGITKPREIERLIKRLAEQEHGAS